MGKRQVPVLIDGDLYERFVAKHGKGHFSGFVQEAVKIDVLSTQGDMDIGVAQKRKEAILAQVAPLNSELQQIEAQLTAAEIRSKQEAVMTAEERAALADPDLRCQWCGHPYSDHNQKLLGSDKAGQMFAENGHVCARCALADTSVAQMLREGMSVVEIKKALGGRV